MSERSYPELHSKSCAPLRSIDIACRKIRIHWDNREIATRSHKNHTSVCLASVGDETFNMFDGFSLVQRNMKMVLIRSSFTKIEQIQYIKHVS